MHLMCNFAGVASNTLASHNSHAETELLMLTGNWYDLQQLLSKAFPLFRLGGISAPSLAAALLTIACGTSSNGDDDAGGSDDVCRNVCGWRELVVCDGSCGDSELPGTGAAISFDPLNGKNKDRYRGHTEGNFTVTAVGVWHEAHCAANPTPGIFETDEYGVISVTENTTGQFTFASVDIAHDFGTSRPVTYQVRGFLDGSTVFIESGTVANCFETIASPDPAQVLDTLMITMTGGIATRVIDNIIVNTIPPIPLAGTEPNATPIPQ